MPRHLRKAAREAGSEEESRAEAADVRGVVNAGNGGSKGKVVDDEECDAG